mmetsp:Transcript_25016/g.43906  ORF Transcript_25016/g.43906 Transcript_25016/m.43906 type:complete len:287 (-) Transcript_25016:7-867(-)
MDDILVFRITTLASFFVFYCTISALVRKVVEAPPKDASDKEVHDYYGQHISFVHSLLAVISAFIVYFHDGGIHYHAPTQPKHTIVLAHSLGYFCYDMLYAEIFKLHNNAMRLHHCCVLFGGAVLFLSPLGGSFAMLCVITTEMSNPFQQCRFILKTKQKENTVIFNFVEVNFCAFFIFNRSFVVSYVIYNVMMTEIGLHIKACMVTVYGLGFFWIFLILSLIAKKMKTKKQLNLLEQMFVSSIDWIRKRMYLLWTVIVTWTLFLTVVTRLLDWPHIHLQWNGFIIA